MDRFDVPHDCSVELSPMGYDFLSDLFQRHDKVRTTPCAVSLY